MNTLNKQPLGTIAAFRHDYGITMGIYGEYNCVSLEYDPKENKNVLLIRDDYLGSIEVKHVDGEWNEIKARKLKNNLLSDIIDELEDWLEKKGVRIPNDERDTEDPDCGANFWGDDFDWFMEMMREHCRENGIIVEDEWDG